MKNAADVCPINRKPSNKKTDLRGTVMNATKGITLMIKPEHVERAKCLNAGECVIAQALGDLYGDFMASFQVGPSCTKIQIGDKIMRYKTPVRLKNSLKLFDVTGKWELPPGQYTLLPYTGAKPRWDKKKKKKDQSGKKQDVFRGHPAVPTRRVLTVRQMLNV